MTVLSLSEKQRLDAEFKYNEATDAEDEKEKQKKREKILNSKDWKDCEQKKIRELGAPKTNLDRAVITFSCEKDLNVSLQ